MDDLGQAREAARQYLKAAREMAEFVDRIGDLPDPAVEAEYATILAREEEARGVRQDALHRLGLNVPSLEGQE